MTVLFDERAASGTLFQPVDIRPATYPRVTDIDRPEKRAAGSTLGKDSAHFAAFRSIST